MYMSAEDARDKIRNGQRAYWVTNWADESFAPAWKGRGVAPEIVEAIEDRWFPETGRVLDIGCGEGEIAAWFSSRGYSAVGCDIAPSVVDAARSKHISVENQQTLNFLTLDITESTPPNLSFDIVIDRGCLHAIHPILVKNYVRNLSAVCSPNAKMLLFIRAFRGDVEFNDQQERSRLTEAIVKIFDGEFKVRSCSAANIGKTAGQPDNKWLPGLVFKLERV
jgi:SAM-dependent methyltransferase